MQVEIMNEVKDNENMPAYDLWFLKDTHLER